MLTETQLNMLDQLTDEFVDDQTLADEEEVNMVMASIQDHPEIYDRWNIWNASFTVGPSAPVMSGSAQSPPTCMQNGSSPCASCDCC